MILGLGTALEQWRESGVEVFLGRLTAQELHDLGAKILSDVIAQEVDDIASERDELRRRVKLLEQQRA